MKVRTCRQLLVALVGLILVGKLLVNLEGNHFFLHDESRWMGVVWCGVVWCERERDGG